MICSYLTPTHVLNTFFHYNDRLRRCISEYHQKINLTNYLYPDLIDFLDKFSKNEYQPSTLILSNAKISKQIGLFMDTCDSINFKPKNINHLSLLECTSNDFNHLHRCLKHFKTLKSLHIIESTLLKTDELTKYRIRTELYEFIFSKLPKTLIELKFIHNHGLILNKQLSSNNSLQRLIISLYDINDLYVLLDGLVPNLIYLNVTICQLSAYKRLSLPKSSWSNKFMAFLKEFHLITLENVSLTFEQLNYIIMPLKQLNKLILNIKQFLNNDNQSLKILFEKYLPKLQDFSSFIQTIDHIDLTLNQCSNSKGFYTIPWSFEQLYISMLDNDDRTSICSNVEHLIIDIPYSNLSLDRFPNLHTLTIQSECKIDSKFYRLDHLIMKHINQEIPISLLYHIHTLTLFEIEQLANHLNIYSNISHLIIKDCYIGTSTILINLFKHFPNIRSLEIQLENNIDYYDNLDILLNQEYLPYLSWLKTNWIEGYAFYSNIDIWISSKTSLKWNSKPYEVYYDKNHLIISL